MTQETVILFVGMFALIGISIGLLFAIGRRARRQGVPPVAMMIGVALFAMLSSKPPNGLDSGQQGGNGQPALAEDGGASRDGGGEGGGAPRNGGDEHKEAEHGFTLGGMRGLPAEAWTNRPPNAVVHERWTRYGVSQDTFYIQADGWEFPVWGEDVKGVWVSANGTLMFDRGDGATAADNMFSVMRGPVGIVPSMGGCLWHAVTSSNSVLFTWEHVFLGRDPGYPVTFQVELFESGDFAFRHVLLDAGADYSAVLPDFTIGARYNGKGFEWRTADTSGDGHGGAMNARAAGAGARNDPDPEENPFTALFDLYADGAEIYFNVQELLGVIIEQDHLCYHSGNPLEVSARPVPDFFHGTYIWTYGGLTLTGKVVSLPRSAGWKTNWPDTATVEFRTKGHTATTNCPVWYCLKAGETNGVPGGVEGSGCGHGEDCTTCGANYEEYCGTCDVWWWPDYHGQPHPPCYDPSGGDGQGVYEKPVPFAPYVQRGTLKNYHVSGFPFERHRVRFYPHGGRGGGMCCPCPLHRAHHTTPAKLIFSSGHISLTRTNGIPLAVNSTVSVGEAVVVAGMNPSTLPWDATAVFEWEENDTATVQTNAFTVMNSPVNANIDLRTGNHTSNNIHRSLFPLPGDWAIPVTPNAYPHHFEVCALYAALPGYHTLSLESADNAARVWAYGPYYDDSGPLLVPGQSVTNPAGTIYYFVEALAPGTATLTYSFTGTGIATNLNCSHSVTIRAVETPLRLLTDLTRPDDGLKDMFGSYVPGRHDITNSMITLKGSTFTPQKMKLVAGVPDGIGVSEVRFTLHGISRIPGFCENASAPSGTGPNDNDFSFSPTANSNLVIAAVTGGTVAVDFYCKDYGGSCTVMAEFITTNNAVFATITKEVPIDTGGNGIADAWEQHWVNRNNTENAFHPVVWTPELFQDTGWDGETAELGWQHYAFGYTHASGGDGLTVWQEYRGYLVDGGKGITEPRHVSLSPFRKELLVQVSAPELASLLVEAGTGPASNAGVLSAFNVDEIMQSVAELYADMSRGAGIDLYWVKRELNPLPIGGPVSYGNGYGRPDAFRYTGEMFYLPSPVINNNLTGTAQITADGLYSLTYTKPVHDALFLGETQVFRNEIAQNRDPSLKGFVVVLFKARAATVLNNGSVRPIQTAACRAYLDGEPTQQGAIILTTMVSEENPFRYTESHYTPPLFKSYLAWAVAHEIAHLIGCDDMLNPASGRLMGLRTLIGGTTISSTELLQINLKNRKGVTP